MEKALAVNCNSFSLQLYIKEDALVKFKSELAVLELEVQVKISCHLLNFRILNLEFKITPNHCN